MSQEAIVHDGFTITSTDSPEEVRTALGIDQDEEASKAASVLGKKSAERRKTATVSEPGETGRVDASPAPDTTVEVTDDSGKVETEEPAKEASDEATEEKAEEKPKSKKGDPRHDPIARMKEATQREAEAKREARRVAQENADLKARLEAIEARIQQPTAKPEPKEAAAEEDPKPVSDDFETYEDFVEARARWAARQEYAERETQSQQRRALEAVEKQIHKRAVTFTEKMEAAKEDPNIGGKFKPEFLEKFLALYPASLVPPEHRRPVHYLAEEVFNSAEAPRMLLYLQEHPDVIQRLVTLHPADIVREMARIEARLDAAPTATASRPVNPQAKPPVRPVTGAPGTTGEIEPTDDMPFDQWYKLRDAQERAKRKASR